MVDSQIITLNEIERRLYFFSKQKSEILLKPLLFKVLQICNKQKICSILAESDFLRTLCADKTKTALFSKEDKINEIKHCLTYKNHY